MEKQLKTEQKQACLRILDYLTLKDDIHHADVIFIAGGSLILPAEKAAELYHQKVSEKIAFVSRFGTFSNPEWKSDAEAFRKRLLELDIPDSALYWKSEATNTFEEAQMLVPFLHSRNVYPRTIILITRPFHQRRVYATFKKASPEIEFINAPVQEDIFTKASIGRLLGELDRLEKYANKGDLLPQEIPLEIKNAATLLRTTVDIVVP